MPVVCNNPHNNRNEQESVTFCFKKQHTPVNTTNYRIFFQNHLRLALINSYDVIFVQANHV